MRIAALWVADFPLQALRRSQPELAETPLAVTINTSRQNGAGDGRRETGVPKLFRVDREGVMGGPEPGSLSGHDRLVAVSEQACELGVRRGMTVAQARQVAPAIILRFVPDEVMAAAAEALIDVAQAFSPKVARHTAGEVLLDATGLVPRFGSETQVANELWRACRRVGLEAHIGIAGNVDVARVAARTDEIAVVVEGGEQKLLSPLPVSFLQPTLAVATTLARWGVRTAGELARLPRHELSLRLGPEGIPLHRLASGLGNTELVPDPIREELREGVRLDEPLVALEGFLFVLRSLLSRLHARLDLVGNGFAEVLLDLSLEDGEHREIRLKIISPTREVATVLALARLKLEASPPGAPVDGVRVLVTPGKVRLMQGSLFGPPLPAPGKLATVLARLEALVGPDHVGSPWLAATHQPAAFTLAPFVPVQAEGAKTIRNGAGHATGKTSQSPPGVVEIDHPPVLRAFRPAQEAQVVVAGQRPLAVRVGKLGGTVVAWAGPYRFLGDWWTEKPFAREDFDVATADGSLLRVYFDRMARIWFADGIYD